MDGTFMYVCQKCQEAIENFERTQMLETMTKELPALHLCLCPQCAFEYRRYRSSENVIKGFLSKIKRLNENDFKKEDPIKVSIEGSEIWFTQTHAAEIRELLNFIDIDDVVNKKPDDKTLEKKESYPSTMGPIKEKELAKENKEDKADDSTKNKTAFTIDELYRGRRIRHRMVGNGVVKEYKDDLLTIRFDDPKIGTKSYGFKKSMERKLLELL